MTRDAYAKHYATKHRRPGGARQSRKVLRSGRKKEIRHSIACRRCGALVPRDEMAGHLKNCFPRDKRENPPKVRSTASATPIATASQRSSRPKREKTGRCPQCGKAVKGSDLLNHIRQDHKRG